MSLKKIILLGSGIITLLLLVFNYVGTFALCGSKEYGDCMDTLAGIMRELLPVIPLFIFSLITYKMPEKVFQAWAWFALPWAVFSMLLIYMAPEYGQGGFGPSISLDKGFVAFLMSGAFVIVSVLTVAGRYLILRLRR